ncbi:AfsR/SARP family transcriptional regulator [Thermoactinospora rubra]|uniref:AfsR/SARP family transcriptional regulator n=1 Tax=Thermoactinospora rubra TaxID=1088767 RepID=UPI001301BD04|nr:transcriptional regulator [Thermoactinospora rubra]
MEPAPRSTGGTGDLRIALLGPFEVRRGAVPIELGSNRLRALLAVLAMSAGETVSIEQLAVALWAEDLPANQRRSIQTYVARLRPELGPDAIRTTPAGYRLEVDPEQVDALRFRRLVGEAAPARGIAEERRLLDEALALWRGDPFDGVDSDHLHGPKASRLVELRLSAVERWIDLSLAEGRHGEIVAEVRELAARHPLRESLWGRLLLTLDRCGRQAEALAMYEQLRSRLAEELGTDPAPELQCIHAALLDGGAWQAEPVVPRQLPPAVADFTGRRDVLKEMDRLLGEGTRICVVTGTAGVGKTSLAVHWAHRAAERFPDGQLYIDLQGFGSSGAPLRPQDALSILLQAMGVARHRIPDDPEAAAMLYRTMLAGKRTLVILDNARDADQVRRLLPGGAGCAAVVTSRRGLSSLVTREGAMLVTLGVLTRAEARDLLARRLGRERTETEAQATDEIVDLCARLPLALVIAAGRAAANPGCPLSALAAILRGVRDDVGVLASRDSLTDMRSVLSHSYEALCADAARLFRLLATHPGPDISRTAAAALTGVAPTRADRLLDALLDAHLVAEIAPGRVAFCHDLLRTYARDLTRAGRRATARRTECPADALAMSPLPS